MAKYEHTDLHIKRYTELFCMFDTTLCINRLLLSINKHCQQLIFLDRIFNASTFHIDECVHFTFFQFISVFKSTIKVAKIFYIQIQYKSYPFFFLNAAFVDFKSSKIVVQQNNLYICVLTRISKFVSSYIKPRSENCVLVLQILVYFGILLLFLKCFIFSSMLDFWVLGSPTFARYV